MEAERGRLDDRTRGTANFDQVWPSHAEVVSHDSKVPLFRPHVDELEISSLDISGRLLVKFSDNETPILNARNLSGVISSTSEDTDPPS